MVSNRTRNQATKDCCFGLELTEGPLQGKVYLVKGQRTIKIGRIKTPKGLQIKDPSVSERHAELVHDENGWKLRDVGSSNGTKVNGSSLEEGVYVNIKVGDVIRFGPESVGIVRQGGEQEQQQKQQQQQQQTQEEEHATATIDAATAIPHDTATVQEFVEAECARMEDELMRKGEQLAHALREAWIKEKTRLLSGLEAS